MTTKREIIAQALEDVGLAGYDFDASPEELQSFLRRMDRMAAEWDGIFIRAGYSMGGDLDSESGLPDTSVNCFAVNLAVRMAPSFGKTIAPTKSAEAAAAMNALYVSLRRMPTMVYPSRLPTGTGIRRGSMTPQYFGPNDGETPGLNADATEY